MPTSASTSSNAGVIFVDLSLAQIAALGATIALLLPYSDGDPHAPFVYWISLAFTFIGAAIFATIRVRHARIPQEAIIGICYAVASAAAILAMSKATSRVRAPEGHAGRQHPRGVVARGRPRPALLYGAIGLFHYIFRKPFLAISMSHENAEASGLNVRLWDFLFYASFGFVVTSSVAIAGVLLVFCYLIVPSVGGDAVRREHRPAPGDRVDDGHRGIGIGRVAVTAAGSADGRDDRLHLSRGHGDLGPDGAGAHRRVVDAWRSELEGFYGFDGSGFDRCAFYGADADRFYGFDGFRIATSGASNPSNQSNHRTVEPLEPSEHAPVELQNPLNL